MRGEREAQCLSDIRESYSHLQFFGFSLDDKQTFQHAIFSAEPNQKPSEFPDFIFQDGFIEHFQISSFQTTRKGSVYQREKSQISREIDSFKSKMYNEPSFDTPKSAQWEQPYHDHSYENLVKSFKASWEGHIESLLKSKFNYKTSIFLVDYPEMSLSMHVDYDAIALKSNIEYGDLLYRLPFKFYRISRDKDLLRYVYEYASYIDYFVCRGVCSIDVIKVSNIPEILKLLVLNYRISPISVVGETTFVTGISIRDDVKEGNKE